MRLAGFKPGQKVAVIRLGGLGPVAVLYAKAMGGRVAVISSSPDKQEEAHELGAEYFVNTKAQKAVDARRERDGRANIILATAPSREAATEAVPGLAPDGTLVVLGVGSGNIEAGPMDLIMGGRRVMGSPSGGAQRCPGHPQAFRAITRCWRASASFRRRTPVKRLICTPARCAVGPCS